MEDFLVYYKSKSPELKKQLDEMQDLSPS